MNLMKAGLEWGCPYILYWEMYDNEIDKNGDRMGFWMIDDKNEKQPVYYTHQNYYKEMKTAVENYYTENKEMPSETIFLNMARKYFNDLVNK